MNEGERLQTREKQSPAIQSKTIRNRSMINLSALLEAKGKAG